MSNIIPFNYESQQIRLIQDEQGEPWWVAKDICDILGIKNPREAVSKLKNSQKNSVILNDGNRGNPKITIINEPGLYKLIMKSKKPDAERFQDWITEDVLPSIRKTGKYEIDSLSEIDLIIKSAHALKKIDERLTSLEAKSHYNSGHTGYWTITAWCKLNKFTLTLDEANRKGRDAVKLSREWGVDIGKVKDERFGAVNSYREDVLDEIFSTTEVCS